MGYLPSVGPFFIPKALHISGANWTKKYITNQTGTAIKIIFKYLNTSLGCENK